MDGALDGALDGNEQSDEQLVAAYVAGDGRAFDILVGRYAGRVYAVCFRYFGNASDAEDAAQDTFVALLRRAETFRGHAGFSTWLHRVTVNTCHDLARRRARRPRSSGIDAGGLADQVVADDLLANRELGLELREAMATLDPEQRLVVALHDVQGLPYAEIAKFLDMPIGTVKSRIHRAHARLAASLAHLRDKPGSSGEPLRHPRPPSTEP